ncbi:MAG: ogt, partial [Bryobacterales bacterium]|nr:ogt [Bryobacterales bacterium]
MTIETPFGPAWAAVNEAGALEAFGFGEAPAKASGQSEIVARQIQEYCAGTRTSFDLQLNPKGTDFQK